MHIYSAQKPSGLPLYRRMLPHFWTFSGQRVSVGCPSQEAPMFARIKKSGNYQYLQIVENRKVHGQMIQRVIATISGCFWFWFPLP